MKQTTAKKVTAAKKPRQDTTLVNRSNSAIAESTQEIYSTMPELVHSIFSAILALLVIVCDVARIIFNISLKGIITVPNKIDNFIGGAFSSKKEGRIMSLVARILVIGIIFWFFLALIANITYPIGKLAILNVCVRNAADPYSLETFLQYKNEIYFAGGLTGGIANQNTLFKIICLVGSIYIDILAVRLIVLNVKAILKFFSHSPKKVSKKVNTEKRARIVL